MESSSHGKLCSPISGTATRVLHRSSYDPIPQKSSLKDTLKEFMEITGQSSIQVLQSESSLEDALKEFMEKTSQTIQELKNFTVVDGSAIQEIEDATMANTSAIQRLEGQLNHLAAELNRMEEDEFQSQLMATGHYMIDEDDSRNLHLEHVQATATLGSEVIFEKIVSEPSLKVLLERAVINLNSTLTWYLSKMRHYWIPLLRYDLRMGKALRYHSPPHLLQQLRRKRKESTWSLLSTLST
jgi:flavin-binding protein dodecin